MPAPPSARPLAGTALAGALGLNLWLLGLVVPLAFSHGARVWPLAPIGPLLLGFGLARRSPPALLLGVPAATLAPLAMPELEAARQHAGGFVLLAASLAAYVVAALRLLERARARAAVRATPIEAGEVPRVWARRIRIYRAAAALAALCPALLIYAVDLHPPTVAAMAASFPGGAERAQALATAGAGLVAALVFAVWLARPLAAHLEHDVEVRVRLEQSRLVARRGRPRPAFYAAVGVALALMGAVLALHR